MERNPACILNQFAAQKLDNDHPEKPLTSSKASPNRDEK
jgi:hypothetical protein